MKQWIMVFGAITLIVLLYILQINYLTKTSRYLLADITDIQNCIDREDYENALESINGLEQTWSDLKTAWRVFSERENVELIDEKIQSIKAYAKYEEQDELAAETAILYNRIKVVIENEKLSFSNVL